LRRYPIYERPFALDGDGCAAIAGDYEEILLVGGAAQSPVRLEIRMPVALLATSRACSLVAATTGFVGDTRGVALLARRGNSLRTIAHVEQGRHVSAVAISPSGAFLAAATPDRYLDNYPTTVNLWRVSRNDGHHLVEQVAQLRCPNHGCASARSRLRWTRAANRSTGCSS
jgi:hypothetical protein